MRLPNHVSVYYNLEIPPPLKIDLVKARGGYSGINRAFRGKDEEYKGVDFHAPDNTPVYAISGGTVIAAVNTWTPGDGNISGNLVIIEHNRDLASGYLHLLSTTLEIGEWVKPGQEIGRSGHTGGQRAINANFPGHTLLEKQPRLHFQMMTVQPDKNGKFRLLADPDLTLKYVDRIIDSPKKSFFQRIVGIVTGPNAQPLSRPHKTKEEIQDDQVFKRTRENPKKWRMEYFLTGNN